MLTSRHHYKRYPFVATGMLLWVMLVLGFYYWIHKPITPAFARAAGGAMFDVVVSMCILIAAAGLGRKLLARIVDFAVLGVAERVASAGLIGLSVLSLALLIVGTVQLNSLSVAVLLFAVVAFSLRDVAHWLSDLRNWSAGGLPSDPWARFLAVITLMVLFIALLLAVLPPTKWDVLTYHLAGAEQYVTHGRFYAVEHNHFLGFPQLVDTLFAGQLALTGQLTGPAVLHWAIGGMLLLAAGGYTARHAGSLAGWAAVGVLIAAKSIWLEMSFAYVDLMPIGLAVVALIVIEQWRDVRRNHSPTPASRSHEWRYLALIGALAGFGMGVKYSVLWLVISLGFLVLWLSRRDGWLSSLRNGAIYGVVALLVFAPWLIRNVLWYDSPVYPLVFPAAEMDSIRHEWYSQPESGLFYSDSRWQIPVLPLSATFLGMEGAGAYGTDIGPLFLILIPLLLIVWRALTVSARRVVRYALVIAGVTLVAWWLSATFGSYISLQTRLVLYMFGPLAIVSGITLEALRRLPKKPFDVYFVVRALVGLALVFTAIDAVRYLNNSGINEYFSGEADYEETYLEHALGWHYVTMQQINGLPAGSTVRFLWEPRYLYCDDERLNCHTDSLMDAWYYARRTIGEGDPAAIAFNWRAKGADFLLVYEFGRDYEEENADLYTADDWEAWNRFVDEQLVEIWRNGNAENDIQYILFRWREFNIDSES